jgi:hypothetical protein
VTASANEKSSFSAKRWAWCLVLITATGAALRLAGANVPSFWYDEAVTARLSKAEVFDLLAGKQRDNGNPPLYWLVAKVAGLLCGPSEISYRFPSILFAVITVPAIAFLGKRLVSAEAGLFAAGLFSCSPFSLELSTEARAYALLHLLATVNTICLLSWIEKRGRLRAVLYVLTTACLCLTHYYAIAVPIVHGLSLPFTDAGRKLLLPWAGLVAAAGLTCSFWVPGFFDQFTTPGNLSRGGESWYVQFFATPLAFALGRTFAWRDQSLLALICATVAAVLAFWSLVAVGLRSLRDRPHALVLLVLWLLLPVVLPGAAALLGKRFYHIRAGSVALPAVFILAGAGLAAMRHSWRIGFCVVLAALVTVSTVRFFALPLKDDWRAATPAVLAMCGPGEAVVFDTDIEVVSFGYYASKLGPPPDPMFAVTSPLASDGSLCAIRYERGTRVGGQAENMADQILAARGICLVLCLPVTRPEEYTRFFSEHGFVVDRTLSFFRILVMHLKRVPPQGFSPSVSASFDQTGVVPATSTRRRELMYGRAGG